MRKIRFKDLDGDLCEAKTKKETCALEHIYKRLKEVAPAETIELETAKMIVLSFNVSFERSLTPKEATDLVSALKLHIIKAMDKADKYYVSKDAKANGKGGNGK